MEDYLSVEKKEPILWFAKELKEIKDSYLKIGIVINETHSLVLVGN